MASGSIYSLFEVKEPGQETTTPRRLWSGSSKNSFHHTRGVEQMRCQPSDGEQRLTLARNDRGGPSVLLASQGAVRGGG